MAESQARSSMDVQLLSPRAHQFGKVIVWDSHPVQYKVPVYVELNALVPGGFKVLYATDCSVKGYLDRQFGRHVAWDIPLLEGYESDVLNNERGTPLSGFRSLSGRGIYQRLKRERPRGILLSQFLYEADFVTLLSARRLGIPVAIRHETQDEAFRRSTFKNLVRSVAYRIFYCLIDRVFYIGELSREHLLRHGCRESNLIRAPYCVQDPVRGFSEKQKRTARLDRRQELGIRDEDYVVLFSGKLIPKKNPGLLLEAVARMPEEIRRRTKVVFMGVGELDAELRRRASDLSQDVIFLGFVNQSGLASNYLAADVLALPSFRMGETWGLVVNEALHSGCSVVITDAVGCYREFGGWERVQVIPEGDSDAAAAALSKLSQFTRSFVWCASEMERYSVRAAAEAIAGAYFAQEKP